MYNKFEVIPKGRSRSTYLEHIHDDFNTLMNFFAIIIFGINNKVAIATTGFLPMT